jgi:hypothetical protein
MQLDEDDAAPVCGGYECRRQGCRVAPAKLNGKPDDPDIREIAEIAGQAGGVVGQGDAGGQDQLAAAQLAGDVDHFADVDPAHRVRQAGRTGDDPWGSLAHWLQSEDFGYRRQHPDLLPHARGASATTAVGRPTHRCAYCWPRRYCTRSVALRYG